MAKKVVVKGKPAEAPASARAPLPAPVPPPRAAPREQPRPQAAKPPPQPPPMRPPPQAAKPPPQPPPMRPPPQAIKPPPPPPPVRAAPAAPLKPQLTRLEPVRPPAFPRPGLPARKEPRPPPELDLLLKGEEHRQFPRAKLAVRFELWIGEGEDRSFAASLKSTNLSVSGAFLESTFFLPMGTELRVSFQLDEGEEPVQARAEIIREERSGEGEEGTSGFGLRFVEFFSQTEVTLAKLFLGERLRVFSEEYLSSKRARSLTNEHDRVIDALAAWELLKVTSPADPWRQR